MAQTKTARKRAPRIRASATTPKPAKSAKSVDVRQLALLLLIQEARLPAPEPEYQFARAQLGRQWRLDWCWRAQRICLEVEGGTRIAGGGGHQRVGRGGRYLSDMEKYNTLACWGWILVRVTYEMIADGRALTWLLEAFAYRAGQAA